MKLPTAEEPVEISAYIIWIDENEIVRARVKDNAEIDLKEAQEMTETLLKITPDASRPLLVDMGKMKYITKRAREHFKGGSRKVTATAVALLAKSQLSTLIGNFYLGLNRPKLPTKLFTSESQALQWLKKYL
jgi:hypothetical protein